MPTSISPSSQPLTAYGLKSNTATFTVDNTTGTSAVAVAIAGTAPDRVSVSPAQVAAGASTTVTVTYYLATTGATTATLSAGTASATLSFTPQNPLTIASSVDFGTITPGSSSINGLSIQNQSDDTAGTLTAATAPFSYPSSWTTIPSNALATISATYSPTAVNTDSQQLTLSVGSWTATCTLTGICSDSTEDPAQASDEDSMASDTVDTSNQSYFISVPTESTMFNLGRQRSATIKIDGFGVSTTGWGYVNVGEDFGLIAGGDVSLQAGKDMNLVGMGDAVFSGAGSAFLFGNMGVNIGTLSASTTSDTDTDLMPNDDGVLQAKRYMADAMVAFATLDTALAGAQLYLIAKQAVSDMATGGEFWKWSTKKQSAHVVALIAGLAATSVSATNSIGAISATAGTDKGDEVAATIAKGLPPITMFAEGGMLVGTPAFASYYAAAGMVLASLYPLLFGWDTSVMAVNDLALTALKGEANISGDEAIVNGTSAVEIKSPAKIGMSVQTDAVGSATVEMTPTEIEVGLGTWPDTGIGPSLKMEIAELTQGVTSLAGATNVTMEPLKIEVECETVGAAEKTKLEMAPTEITLDAGPTGKIVLKAGTWQIEIDGTSGIKIGMANTAMLDLGTAAASLASGATTSVKLTPADMNLAAGASKIQVAAAGITYTGTMHSLG